MTQLAARPGDILAVNTGGGVHNIFGSLIKFAEFLQRKPSIGNHILIVTHQDAAGRWIGIQGQPGGVGLIDCTPYLASPDTRSNHNQTRPDNQGQVASFLASCAASLGIAYDWVAVVSDAVGAFGLHDLSEDIDLLWRWPSRNNLLPGHVVCSTLAARLYEIVGWDHPSLGRERQCEPADWWVFNNELPQPDGKTHARR